MKIKCTAASGLEINVLKGQRRGSSDQHNAEHFLPTVAFAPWKWVTYVDPDFAKFG
jgi:hypothetical protein